MRGAVASAFAAIVLAVAAGAAEPASPGFRFGVAAGEVTSRGALLWTRAGRAGPVILEVARDSGFRTGLRRLGAAATVASDLTVQVQVGGLRPATSYVYRFRQGASVSAAGRFRTAPLPAAGGRVRFAISGDADGTGARDPEGPFYNRFEVYGEMAAEGNDFNVSLGDTIYSDSRVRGATPARTAVEKRAKYRESLSMPALRQLRASAGLYSHWDDHEFANDFSRPEGGEQAYRAGVAAFTDYNPVTYTESDGLYRTFRWGRHVELFFLDERSFRSAKASARGVCNGRGGRPHPAPAMPKAVGGALAAVIAAVAGPAARACLDRIADPARTMLGSRQLARFTADIERSTATFKVVVNEVPIQHLYVHPYDRWEGYAAERETLVRFLRTRVDNVVFLTTDAHATFVNDVRADALEPDDSAGRAILEVVTGPVATRTFARSVDSLIGVPGAGRLLGSLVFEAGRPRGLGMRCVALDTYSYAQVDVTSEALTIELKDGEGRAVRDVGGEPCGLFTVRAR